MAARRSTSALSRLRFPVGAVVGTLEAVERAPVAQHRDREQADREAARGQQTGEERRERHTSTRVVLRISTKARLHSTPAMTSAAMPMNELVISRSTPGLSALTATTVSSAMPATT